MDAIMSFGVGDFTVESYEGRWIPWTEIESASRPGKHLKDGDPGYHLRQALSLPGVYLVASTGGRRPHGPPHPTNNAVVYVGESGCLQRRMVQFGTSAGFFGERGNGHSGAWRWEDSWPKAGAFFALYPAPNDVRDAGLAPLWRLCREAQAMVAYASTHQSQLPVMNAKGANEDQG